MTKGEKRVRVDFNVTKSDYIHEIKTKAAELINLIDSAASKPEWNDETFGEWRRLQSLAMTAIEEGTMWAVKAETI